MRRSAQVVVIGPLAPYAAGYRQELVGRGYSAWTTVSYLYSFARVSRWLAESGLTAADLDPVHVKQFIAERPGGRPGDIARATPRGLMSLLSYLRVQRVVPDVTVHHDPAFAVLDEFASFLCEERGLAAKTIVWYRRFAGMLLLSRLGEPVDVRDLTVQHINAFILEQSGCRGSGSLNNVVTALRSLLRFCYVRGYTLTPLAEATPRTVGWRDLGPSRGLGPRQVERLLASCDRRTSTGRRDFAILTVLARLGLRANEVAALQLNDLDWRAGEITVHGKGNRIDRLPLPVDVGQAVADYCQRGRPRRECRALFVQTKAPYTALSSTAVSRVVFYAGRRAGLPRVGAHQLRHGAACALRRAGAPLVEIGQLLRHQHTVTTVGYARDDQDALAAVVRRWPGGAA